MEGAGAVSETEALGRPPHVSDRLSCQCSPDTLPLTMKEQFLESTHVTPAIDANAPTIVKAVAPV